MISINAQITYVLISFDVWKLTWKNSCKSQNTFWFAENVMTKQVIAFNWIVSWESFLSISRYFYEIAATIRAETSVFHIFRPFHNTLFLSMHKSIIFFVSLNKINKKNTKNLCDSIWECICLEYSTLLKKQIKKNQGKVNISK